MNKNDSTDISREKLNRLEELFPECMTEKNIDGKTVKAFDFDALKEICNDSAANDDERYSFNWAGKTAARANAYRHIDKTLRPCLLKICTLRAKISTCLNFFSKVI